MEKFLNNLTHRRPTTIAQKPPCDYVVCILNFISYQLLQLDEVDIEQDEENDSDYLIHDLLFLAVLILSPVNRWQKNFLRFFYCQKIYPLGIHL